MRNKIFISHRSTDKQVADILLHFLVMCGIPRDFIFCSSLPGNDVNNKISVEVKENMKQSVLNIALLSKDYYESAFCLNESGIIWYEDVKAIAIALPEINENNMYGFLGSEYKTRRLNVDSDISFIYDEAISALEMVPVKSTIITSEISNLIKKYNELLLSRNVGSSNTYDAIFDTNKITTDDERIILYYLLKNKVRKATKDNIKNWLVENEIDDVNIDNAFDLISASSLGRVTKSELELEINLFRDLTTNLASVPEVFANSVKKHTKLRDMLFKELWVNKQFNDMDKLFIAYIIDKNVTTFGFSWKVEHEIAAIKQWELDESLAIFLYEKYSGCLNKFINNNLVYESDFTSYGNPREYKIYNSLKVLLLNNQFPYTEEILAIKKNYLIELPF